MLLVVYFDIGYFGWAEPFIKSVEKHEPNAQIYIHGYNLKPAHVKTLLEYDNVIEVYEDRVKQSWKRADPHMKRNDIKFNPLRFQITCNKGFVLLNAMKRQPKHDLYIITDIDMVFLKSFEDNLKKEIGNKDVGVVIIHEHERIKGGFIAVKNNKKGKRFIRRFHKLVNVDKFYYQKDQKCLYNAFLEGVTSFANLSSKYLSPKPKRNTVIWSAHKSRMGDKKDKIKIFKEFSKNPKKAIKAAKKLEEETEKARIAEKERIKKEQLKKRREVMLTKQYELTVTRRKRNAELRAKKAERKRLKRIKEAKNASKNSEKDAD